MSLCLLAVQVASGATEKELLLVSALAIAMISAVFASVVAAAPVYGKFYCEHSQRHCAAGVLPY